MDSQSNKSLPNPAQSVSYAAATVVLLAVIMLTVAVSRANSSSVSALREEVTAVRLEVEDLKRENVLLARQVALNETVSANRDLVRETELVAPGVREKTLKVKYGNECRTLVKTYFRDPATGFYDPDKFQSSGVRVSRCS
ncbi:MAG: hypothetical protein QMC36_06835 [Patescibacteria group bacterium]